MDAHPTIGVFFMTKHNEAFKLLVVQRYAEGQQGYKSRTISITTITSGLRPN
ncbi:hypothetical protein HALO59_130044 [Halomonas sp. 59]|nr:hypothetical protein HALO59_130044 [Halomonas sp. 59]